MTRLEDKHIPIESIKVKDRFRKDLGDLDDLKESINELKVLNPLIVTSDHTLICGARRLQALKELGWTSVPVRIADDPTEAYRLEAERDENTCRLPMKPLEMFALTNVLYKAYRANYDPAEKAHKGGVAAAEHAAAKRNGSPIPPRDREQTPSFGKRAAKAAGWSYESWRLAKDIVERAASGEPEAQEALEDLERTGKVKTAWRKLHDEPLPEKPAVKIDTERRLAKAKSRHARVAKALYGLEGMCAGFAATDLRYVLAVATTEELDEWDRLLGRAVTTLRALQRDLKTEGSVA